MITSPQPVRITVATLSQTKEQTGRSLMICLRTLGATKSILRKHLFVRSVCRAVYLHFVLVSCSKNYFAFAEM